MLGGREVDVGGEGPNCLNTVQDHLFERSTMSLDSRPLQDAWKLLVLTGKKLAFKFNTWILVPPPYVHLASTHMMNAPRPSPFLAELPLPCIIMSANRW